MPDPITLTTVGTIVLTEGVKFLYKQATEVIKTWLGRKKEGKKEKIPMGTRLPSSVFNDPDASELAIDPTAMESLEGELRSLRGALADYADGIAEVSPDDEQFVETFDAVRRSLEAIHQKAIVLKGEKRDAAQIVINGTVDVATVRGHVAGVRARLVKAGVITGTAHATDVEQDGELYGVDVDISGG